jgi:hypothetical protein
MKMVVVPRGFAALLTEFVVFQTQAFFQIRLDQIIPPTCVSKVRRANQIVAKRIFPSVFKSQICVYA